MKKTIKRTISLLVFSVVLIVSIFPSSAATIKNSDAIKVIENLGIADTVEFPYFKKAYTRIEFAKMLCRMDPEYPVFDNKPDTIADVGITDMDYARYVVGRRYMNLDSQGNFNPKGDIIYSVAVKALASIAGYSLVSDIEGGQDEKYVKFAQSAGILKGVKINNSKQLSTEELARLIVNTLDAAPIEITIDGVQSTAGGLLEKMDMRKLEGTLLATNTRGIGAPLSETGTVNIDNEIYFVDSPVDNYLVGKKVIYYVHTENGIDKVVCVLDATGASSIKVFANDIDSYKFGSTEIEITYGDKKKVKIPYSSMVILNGKPGDLTPEIMNEFTSGQLEIFDSNGDGQEDTVYATVCVNDVAISASASTKVIKLEHATINYERIKDNVVFYENGKVTTVDAIKNHSVVGVAADSYTYNSTSGTYDYTSAKQIEIFVSNKKTTGALESKEDDVYEINGASYKLSSYMKNVAMIENEPLQLGKDYVFYLDYFGLLCDFEIDNAAGKMKYGYFIKCGMTGSLNKKLQIKLFTQEGEMKVFDVKDKYILDGEKFENNDVSVMSTPLNIRQLIRYRLREGLIAEIDTDPLRNEVMKIVPSGESAVYDYTSDVSTAVFGYGETVDNSLTTDWGRVSGLLFRGDFNGFDNFKTMIDENTIVFNIPDNYDAEGNYISEIDENQIFIGSPSDFISSRSYDISSHDIGEYGLAKCVILYGSSRPEVSENSSIYVVEKVVCATEADTGNNVYKLTVHGPDGTKILTTVDETEVRFTDKSNAAIKITVISQLNKGDIIRFDTLATGKISVMERTWSIEDERDTISSADPSSSKAFSLGQYYLYKSGPTHFEFTKEADMSNTFAHSFSKAKNIPVYNLSEGTFEVYSGNYERLPSYVNNANRVTIVTMLNWYSLPGAVIYIWN